MSLQPRRRRGRLRDPARLCTKETPKCTPKKSPATAYADGVATSGWVSTLVLQIFIARRMPTPGLWISDFNQVREAVLNLFTLLINVPRLGAFRFVSNTDSARPQHTRLSITSSSRLTRHSRFELMFSELLVMIGLKGWPYLKHHLFNGVKSLHITGLHTASYPGFIRQLMSVPGLQTLNLSGPPDITYDPDPMLMASSTIRKWSLFVSALSTENVAAMISEIRRLEVLHVGYQPSYFEETPFCEIHTAINEHQGSLRELSIKPFVPQGPEISIFDASNFRQLTILDLPNLLLWNKTTTGQEFLYRLPRSLEPLNIAIANDWHTGLQLLRSLAECISEGQRREHLRHFKTLTIEDEFQFNESCIDASYQLADQLTTCGLTFRYAFTSR
ncbi:uncharacterized protein BDV17DRAFT_289968 [Aspergillus undulatus]|uniref:uncharacterized protein n=1 Tax=Aspergillus undulatus TaxID=1810928 RepID=UPI003CCD098E